MTKYLVQMDVQYRKWLPMWNGCFSCSLK